MALQRSTYEMGNGQGNDKGDKNERETKEEKRYVMQVKGKEKI